VLVADKPHLAFQEIKIIIPQYEAEQDGKFAELSNAGIYQVSITGIK